MPQKFSGFPGPLHPAALICVILPGINLLSVAMMAKAPLALILHEGLESLEWPCAAMMTMAVVVVAAAAAAAALVEVGQVRSERTSRAPVCDVTR